MNSGLNVISVNFCISQLTLKISLVRTMPKEFMVSKNVENKLHTFFKTSILTGIHISIITLLPKPL